MQELNDVQSTIDKINTIINGMVCCDFTIRGFTAGNGIEIGGGLSLSWEHTIIIEFEMISFIMLKDDWSVDTTKPFILLLDRVDIDEYHAFNFKYLIEIGNYVFKIFPEHHPNCDFYIAAKGIKLVKG